MLARLRYAQNDKQQAIFDRARTMESHSSHNMLSVVISFILGLLVSAVVIAASIIFAMMAWSFLQAIVEGRTDEPWNPTERLFYLGGAKGWKRLFPILVHICFAVMSASIAIILPVLFVNINMKNQAMIAGSIVTLACVVIGITVFVYRNRANKKEQSKGVGGWLLLFCVGLTILAPLLGLYRMSEWVVWGTNTSTFPSLRSVILFEYACSILMLAYGAYIGAVIWGGSPEGRRLARQFLLVYLLGTYAYQIIVFLKMAELDARGELPSGTFVATGTSMFGTFSKVFFYFIVWWQYFKKSKRVKNTYIS